MECRVEFELTKKQIEQVEPIRKMIHGCKRDELGMSFGQIFWYENKKGGLARVFFLNHKKASIICKFVELLNEIDEPK
jgi:hypothetical protein